MLTLFEPEWMKIPDETAVTVKYFEPLINEFTKRNKTHSVLQSYPEGVKRLWRVSNKNTYMELRFINAFYAVVEWSLSFYTVGGATKQQAVDEAMRGVYESGLIEIGYDVNMLIDIVNVCFEQETQNAIYNIKKE